MAVADVVLTGSGAGMLVNSLLPWYGYDARGWHPTYDGFQSGFLAFFPLLIVVLTAGTSAARAWTGTDLGTVASTSLSWDGVFLAGDLFAALLVVLFWTTLPSLIGAATGAKVGTFLGLLLIMIQSVGAALALGAARMQLPRRLRRAPAG